MDAFCATPRAAPRQGHWLAAPVRVLAATHRDLEAAIREKEFREDLFYRLTVVVLRVPPLSDRTEDIPALVRFFMQRYAPDLGVEAPSIQPEAIEWLQKQPWPGNFRELENVVRQSLLAARPFAIALEHVQQVLARARKPAAIAGQIHAAYIAHLLARVQRGEEQAAFTKMVADLEPELYAQAIRLAQGNQAKAARWLGVTRLKMPVIESVGVNAQQPLHPGHQIGSGRLAHQVKMVAHQTPPVDLPVRLLAGLPQRRQEQQSVLVIFENRLSAVSPCRSPTKAGLPDSSRSSRRRLAGGG